MISSSKSDWLRRNAAWLATALAILAMLAWAFVTIFKAADNMSAPTFGTAWAPYSDSLGPWLEGALSFLFGLSTPGYVYRPTVALFWGSILAVTGRVELIPGLFTALLLGVFAAATLFGGETRIRNGITVGLGICALAFPQTWNLIYVSSLNVDLPALALTSSAMLLLLSGRGPRAHLPLLVGCACLGIAATIRGPMMLAGIPIIAIRLLLAERAPPKVIAASILLFLAPLAVEASLQRHLGVVNNGVMAMYCFYADPAHGWTPACNIQYVAVKPANAQVLQEYLQFLLSGAARTLVFDAMSWRVARDFALMLAGATLVFLACAGLLASWSERNLLRDPLSSPIVRAAAVVALLLVLRLLGAKLSWGALALCAMALAAATALRLWGTVMCLAGYLLGTLFLCLLGLHMNDRLQHTFTVCLYLGFGLLILEARSAATPDASPHFVMRRAVPIVLAVAIGLLYVGNYAAPSRLRDIYDTQVRGHAGAAIKLTSDPRINRSLYYSGDRALFYTTHDPFEVGYVRKYRRLATSITGNVSFLEPNAFVD